MNHFPCSHLKRGKTLCCLVRRFLLRRYVHHIAPTDELRLVARIVVKPQRLAQHIILFVSGGLPGFARNDEHSQSPQPNKNQTPAAITTSTTKANARVPAESFEAGVPAGSSLSPLTMGVIRSILRLWR